MDIRVVKVSDYFAGVFVVYVFNRSK